MNTVQPIRDKALIEEIKNRLAPRDRFMFTLGINVGCRISDLLELKVKDVRNKTHLVITEEKTGKEKRFRLNPQVQAMILEYTEGMDDDAWLFPSRKQGGHIKRVQAYKILNKVAREVGLEEIGTHTLRKTFGYWFYKRTKDVATLQYIFNHSAPSVTLRYIGITQDNVDALIEDFFL